LNSVKVIEQCITDQYAIYHGDSCEVLKGIPDNTIHFEIYSPPFSSLFIFSDSERDLSNNNSNKEFFDHFQFMAKELYRVLMHGRLMSVHCADLGVTKNMNNGELGIYDFSGELIRFFCDIGFIYHSRVVIWKDPLVAAVRTKTLGLLHKTIVTNSTSCRQGIPDYILTFRKPGINEEPVKHPKGLVEYFGDMPIRQERGTIKYSHYVWRRYASPVWMDIDQSDTLQFRSVREDKDEKHIAPLQLGVIRRCVELWTNKNDVVLSPFGGIGSEPIVAIEMERRAIAIELKQSYYKQMEMNCKKAVLKKKNLGVLADD
jgi:DNA modification methylase